MGGDDFDSDDDADVGNGAAPSCAGDGHVAPAGPTEAERAQQQLQLQQSQEEAQRQAHAAAAAAVRAQAQAARTEAEASFPSELRLKLAIVVNTAQGCGVDFFEDLVRGGFTVQSINEAMLQEYVNTKGWAYGVIATTIVVMTHARISVLLVLLLPGYLDGWSRWCSVPTIVYPISVECEWCWMVAPQAKDGR